MDAVRRRWRVGPDRDLESSSARRTNIKRRPDRCSVRAVDLYATRGLCAGLDTS
jgi:hypothetical protein